MNTKHHVKLVQEGNYLAEVDVLLQEDETGWSPYLSSGDALRLDRVRRALQDGEVKKAATMARVFKLVPLIDERESSHNPRTDITTSAVAESQTSYSKEKSPQSDEAKFGSEKSHGRE